MFTVMVRHNQRSMQVYVVFSPDHVPVAIATKVDATNSVNLLFPFERLLLQTNPSRKSKTSSVHRQDQPLKVSKYSIYTYVYMYICIYVYMYIYTSSNPSLPIRKVGVFPSGYDSHLFGGYRLARGAVTLYYILYIILSSISYCDAGAFVDSEVHHMSHHAKPM